MPTPLAATRLLAPDSLMAPIDEVQFRGRGGHAGGRGADDGPRLNTMTPAQQKREIARDVREMAAARRAVECQRATQARAEREEARARQRSVDNAIRAGGRVVTSRIGQDIIRGIFGTLFGGGKRR